MSFVVGGFKFDGFADVFYPFSSFSVKYLYVQIHVSFE